MRFAFTCAAATNSGRPGSTYSDLPAAPVRAMTVLTPLIVESLDRRLSMFTGYVGEELVDVDRLRWEEQLFQCGAGGRKGRNAGGSSLLVDCGNDSSIEGGPDDCNMLRA